MPAHQLDLQSFVEFVLECSLDNRMTTDAVRGRLTDAGGSSLFQRGLLRLGLVDRLKLQTPSFATGSVRCWAMRCRAGATGG